MFRKIGIILYSLGIFYTPVKAIENYDIDSYRYGYNWGSLMIGCILYKNNMISEDNTKIIFNSIKEKIKNENLKDSYKKILFSFGTKDDVKICRKFIE